GGRDVVRAARPRAPQFGALWQGSAGRRRSAPLHRRVGLELAMGGLSRARRREIGAMTCASRRNVPQAGTIALRRLGGAHRDDGGRGRAELPASPSRRYKVCRKHVATARERWLQAMLFVALWARS